MSVVIFFLFLLVQLSFSAQSVRERAALCALVARLPALNSIWGDCTVIQRVLCIKPLLGVGCDPFTQRVISLSLSSLELKGALPPEMGNFTQITFMDFGSNRLSGTIPTQLGKLSTLYQLILRGNSLTGPIPSTFARLGNLRVLYLYQNDLRGTLSQTVFQNLLNLTRLSIGANRLGGTLPSVLGKIPRLSYFSLRENQFSGTLPTEFFNLTIVHLNLQNNQLTGTIPTQIGKQTLLDYIDLDFNQFSGGIPKQLFNIPVLETLSIAENPFLGGTIPTLLGRLTGLSYLFLSRSGISGTIPTHLALLTQLVSLDLSHNSLNGSFISGITRLTMLTSIDISHNALKGQVVSVLGLTSLGRLILNYNRFSNPIPSAVTTCFVQWFPQDQDECALGTHKCPSNSSCVDGFAENVLGYLCACNPGFLQALDGNCTDIDECSTGAAKCALVSQCINTVGSYYCCPSGFTANKNRTNCEDVDECYQGIAYRCATSALCVNTNGSYYCCPNGYTSNGTGCVDVDECYLNIAYNCPTRQQCINLVGSYYCCPDGFVSNGTHCLDVDECYLNIASRCLSKAQCINTNGSYICCPAGFESNGTHCLDIDECYLNIASNCQTREQCVNTNGSYYCCKPGYRSNGTGCVDINECFERTSRCTSQAQCINTPGSYICCPNGFEADLDLPTCVDIDECKRRLHDCVLNDQCINTNGSFYCCPSGFQADINGAGCVDIDECYLNIASNCTSRYKCVNTNGSYFCCGEGYESNENTCVDIDECYHHSHNCTREDLCLNTNGSFACCFNNETSEGGKCQPCFGPPTPVLLKGASEFSSFANVPNILSYSFDFMFCSECNNGIRTESREKRSFLCDGESRVKSICSYACSGLDFVTTAASAAVVLKSEFQKGNFLANILSTLYNIEIVWSQKRVQTGFSFGILNCPHPNTTFAIDLIQSLGQEIVPKAPGLTVAASNNCTFTVSSSDSASESNNIPLIAGLMAGIFLLLLLVLLAALYYYYWSDNLVHLPNGVSWSYRLYKRYPWTWSFRGTRESGYHFKDLDPGSEFYDKALQLWNTLGKQSVSKASLQIVKITAVYNPVLVNNFVGTFRILTTRASNLLYINQKWTIEEEQKTIDQKERVSIQYRRLCDRFEWNKKVTVPIIPFAHGTDSGIAEKICETGFVNLSALDSGYYGKGIYFTSHSIYTVPYIFSKHSPAVIVSYVVPGNVYPVTERHTAANSLMGRPIKSGYSSHYVITGRDGCVIDPIECGEEYDEMVIPQESQITPAFIFHIARDNMKELGKAWARALPDTAAMVVEQKTESIQSSNNFSNVFKMNSGSITLFPESNRYEVI